MVAAAGNIVERLIALCYAVKTKENMHAWASATEGLKLGTSVT